MSRERSVLEKRYHRTMRAFWLFTPVFALVQSAIVYALVQAYAVAPRLYLLLVVLGLTALSYRAAKAGTMALWRRAEYLRHAADTERLLKHDTEAPTRNLRLPKGHA